MLIILVLPHASAFSAALPAYLAWLPSSCSMRSNWLYFAVRSARASEPVLICPQLVATARAGGGADRGAGLDLSAIGGDREVGDGGILGLAGPVRHHRGVAGLVGHLDRA